MKRAEQSESIFMQPVSLIADILKRKLIGCAEDCLALLSFPAFAGEAIPKQSEAEQTCVKSFPQAPNVFLSCYVPVNQKRIFGASLKQT